nr:MAG TPA: Head fiber protein [Bacteriophage sp.]DAH35512.1 MAG TPA: Head fiber protein [Caudoviricetes sp.]
MSNKGYFLHKTKPENIKEALWLEEQCLRRQGGYDLDRTNLPNTLKWIAKGTVLRLVTGGKVQVVKTAKVTEKADKAATTLKIASGSLFKIGDKIAGATISAITSADGVDTLTVSALDNAVAANAVVSDYDKTKDVLLGFSYDTLDVRDQESSIAATPTLQVMEVEEDSLPYPINDDIKVGINSVGIALFKIQ